MDAQALRWRRVSVATVVTMLLLVMMGALTAVPAQAARGITFKVYLGSVCVGGRAGSDAGVNVTWKDSDGSLKQSGFKRANGKGYWAYCGDFMEHVEKGDTIKAKVGSRVRTVTVPRLKMNIDRQTDMVSGKAPGDAALTVTACSRYSFDWANCYDDIVVAAPDGSFSSDFSGVTNVRGRDWVEVSLKEGNDRFLRWLSAPYIRVVRGSARFSGHYRPFRSVTVELHEGATTKDSWTARADDSAYGRYVGRFTDADGHGEWVRTGDRIVASNPGFDADWIVPNVSATVNKRTDVVKGTCVPDRPFKVEATNKAGTKTVKALGKADGSGSFTRDLTKKMDVKAGTVLWIMCSLPSGDVVERRLLVK